VLRHKLWLRLDIADKLSCKSKHLITKYDIQVKKRYLDVEHLLTVFHQANQGSGLKLISLIHDPHGPLRLSDDQALQQWANLGLLIGAGLRQLRLNHVNVTSKTRLPDYPYGDEDERVSYIGGEE
jgi:hypothetical protein